MPTSLKHDTIAAQATACGEAAISVIRISGPLSAALLRDVFSNREICSRRTVHAAYRGLNGEIVDDVLFTFFAGPRSYTGEDAAEISCHGNPLIVRKILGDLIRRGCRLAEPGEFTRLAFLNGRMDLSQAEAVADIIRARSDRALAAARRQLQGGLKERIEHATGELLAIIALLEAHIDFPEEDVPSEDASITAERIGTLMSGLTKLASSSRYGALLRDGVKTVILGAPNAGKSSLLNRLAGHERVIVSDEPGTTRDAIEERIAIGPHCICLVDTAGIRATDGRIELMSIGKTMEQLDQADLLLLILDASLPHPVLPEELLGKFEPKNSLVIQNKMDLPGARGNAASWNSLPEVRISALTGEGIEDLKSRLMDMIDAFNPLSGEDLVAVSLRHSEALNEAIRFLEIARDQIALAEPPELAASHLREALHALGAITGHVDNEKMLDTLFANFCIGK